NEFDLHYRLRPLLRQIAGERLYGRYGLELDRDPDRARALLGEGLWERVRPEREVGGRSGPGLPAAALPEHVALLEELCRSSSSLRMPSRSSTILSAGS